MQHNGCLQCLGLPVKAGINQLRPGHHVEMLSDEMTDSCAQSAKAIPAPNSIAERDLRFLPGGSFITVHGRPVSAPSGPMPPLRPPWNRSEGTAAEAIISPRPTSGSRFR
jgi:hypothetical protein